jgi:hypothetical protein
MLLLEYLVCGVYKSVESAGETVGGAGWIGAMTEQAMSSHPESSWRLPTAWEQAVIQFLLAGEFPGRDEIHAQIDGASVRSVDQDGSLEFQLESGVPAPVAARVPTEAVATLANGQRVHALLFVSDEGFVYLLEFYSEDGSPVTGLPPADAWQRPW